MLCVIALSKVMKMILLLLLSINLVMPTVGLRGWYWLFIIIVIVIVIIISKTIITAWIILLTICWGQWLRQDDDFIIVADESFSANDVARDSVSCAEELLSEFLKLVCLDLVWILFVFIYDNQNQFHLQTTTTTTTTTTTYTTTTTTTTTTLGENWGMLMSSTMTKIVLSMKVC